MTDPGHAHDAAEPRSSPRSTPASLWDTARYYLGCLLSLFGGPSSILALGVLTPRERGEILDWLRPIEALARRLVLVDAAALAVLGEAAALRRAPRRSGAPAPRTVDAADPASWPAPFRVSVESRAASEGREGAAPSSGFALQAAAARSDASSVDGLDPWPIAARLEAVTRVLAAPAPFVRRLAARLTRRNVQAVRALTRPPGAGPGARRIRLGSEAISHAAALADAALAPFDTS